MKQTKKLTRSQWTLLSRMYRIDTTGVRLVEETKDTLKVMFPDGTVKEFSKILYS